MIPREEIAGHHHPLEELEGAAAGEVTTIMAEVATRSEAEMEVEEVGIEGPTTR